MKIKYKGSTMLLVVSIIMLIGAVIGSALLLIVKAAQASVLSTQEAKRMFDSLAPGFSLGLTLAVAASVALIVIAILGIVFSNKPDKALILTVMIIAYIIVMIAGTVMFNNGISAVAAEIPGSQDLKPGMVTYLSGLILPILFLIATLNLKRGVAAYGGAMPVNNQAYQPQDNNRV